MALAAIAVSCQSPTQLVVLVDSDFRVPEELAAVQAVVLDSEGATAGAEFFDLGRYGLPFSFGIEGGELSDEQVRISIQGLTLRDELLVERVAIVEFIPGEKRLLPIFLARSCAGSSCGEGQTCTERGCISAIVDVGALPELEPGDEILYDGGLHPDAGSPRPDTGVHPDGGPDQDTGVDPDDGGGAPDATDGDAGRPDATLDGGTVGCTSDVNCAAGQICVEPNGLDCGATGTCECRLACNPFSSISECSPGQVCWYRGDGVCLDEGLSSAANFRAPCANADGCDPYENYTCHDGECTSLCDGRDPNYCPSEVPNTTCDLNPFTSIGTCLEPTFWSDITAPCGQNNDCQSGQCFGAFGFCSSDCSGLTACPTGSICIQVQATELWCLRYCFADSDCATNPQLTCRTDFQPALCLPRCDTGNYPCQVGYTCDPNTGHCV